MSHAFGDAVYEPALVWNGIPLLTPLTGVGQYTAHLLRELSRRESSLPPEQRRSIQVFLARRWQRAEDLFADSSEPTLAASPEASLAKTRFLRKLLGRAPFLRSIVRNRQAEFFKSGCRAQHAVLYHEPNFIAFPFDGPTVVTVHDLSFIRHPQTHPAERVRFMTRHLPDSIARANIVVTVSDFVRDELIREFGESVRRKIRVVLNGVSQEFTPRDESDPELMAMLAKHQLTHKSYLLSVGTLEPRKNLITLIRAYVSLPSAIKQKYPLVIVGPSGWRTSAFERELARYRSEPIRLLGYIDQQELPLLYTGATLLTYPSIYEGFGLPVVEAMACGTPVIAANASALPQVVGQAGELISPQDVKGFADAIQKITEDQLLAQRYAIEGLTRARELSWATAAEKLRGIYAQLQS